MYKPTKLRISAETIEEYCNNHMEVVFRHVDVSTPTFSFSCSESELDNADIEFDLKFSKDFIVEDDDYIEREKFDNLSDDFDNLQEKLNQLQEQFDTLKEERDQLLTENLQLKLKLTEKGGLLSRLFK